MTNRRKAEALRLIHLQTHLGTKGGSVGKYLDNILPLVNREFIQSIMVFVFILYFKFGFGFIFI